MSDGGSIWKQTVAGVVSALIVLALSWIGGFLPTIWQCIVSAAMYAWRLFTLSIPLPVWGWILLISCVILASRSAFRPKRSPSQSADSSTQDAGPDNPVLTELETAVVGVLTRVDGAWLTLDELASQLRTPRLLIEQSVEKLFSSDFLLDNHNYLHGTSFRLSRKGRDFAIERGFVPASPYAT